MLLADQPNHLLRDHEFDPDRHQFESSYEELVGSMARFREIDQPSLTRMEVGKGVFPMLLGGNRGCDLQEEDRADRDDHRAG